MGRPHVLRIKHKHVIGIEHQNLTTVIEAQPLHACSIFVGVLLRAAKNANTPCETGPDTKEPGTLGSGTLAPWRMLQMRQVMGQSLDDRTRCAVCWALGIAVLCQSQQTDSPGGLNPPWSGSLSILRNVMFYTAASSNGLGGLWWACIAASSTIPPWPSAKSVGEKQPGSETRGLTNLIKPVYRFCFGGSGHTCAPCALSFPHGLLQEGHLAHLEVAAQSALVPQG